MSVGLFGHKLPSRFRKTIPLFLNRRYGFQEGSEKVPAVVIHTEHGGIIARDPRAQGGRQ